MSAKQPASHTTQSKSLAPIAIVGMGGVFPGAADLDQFWDNIKQARSAAAPVPEHRWVMPPDVAFQKEHQPDRTYSRIACLVDDNFHLDPDGLALDASLLEELDPLYLMTLHAGKQAYRSAHMEDISHDRIGVILAAIALPTDGSSALTRATVGQAFAQSLDPALCGNCLTPDAKAVGLDNGSPLKGLNTPGVRFADSSPAPSVGLGYLARSLKSRASYSEYQSLNAQVTALPAMLLAQALQLGGRAFTLDAACASSLYAIKLACDELREGRADAMLAGGVSRPENLYTQIGFSQLRALSPSGRCAPFDQDADGLVVGEGAGIFVLKRLDDAVRDGDNILGVIRGVGLSNDIGGGLLAPDSEGQLRAMEIAYAEAGWDPTTVDLIECHGTGTPLGDKTEFGSLCQLWESSDNNWQTQQCVIGSIKSMIGHLLTGAAAASLVKVLLALQHKLLPPSANFKQPAFAMQKSPFRVTSEATIWPERPELPSRRAAVSAFGFGGINAHLLVEEWKPALADVAIHTTHQHRLVHEPVAVVGLDTHIGAADTLATWAQAVLQGQSLLRPRPAHRWSGADAWLQQHYPEIPEQGAYLSSLELPVGTFRLPPNEIAQLLPQQLLMLQVAAKAMQDAGFALRQHRPRMGAFIGVGFDFECTRFHLRWALWRLAPQWAEQLNLQLTPDELTSWIHELQEALGPALNATRTVGALGGIVASRVAKEFLLGGPSFILSAEESSGIQALELATRALQRNELDAALVGAVDIAGDVTHMATLHTLWQATGQDSNSRHKQAIGEGATAFVLKRLSDAIRDGDRIYATIKGFGAASGRTLQEPDVHTLQRATQQAHKEADITPATISYLELAQPEHASVMDLWSRLRPQQSEDSHRPLALSSLPATTGHLGAISGLAAVAKACLALHHKTLPATPGASLWLDDHDEYTGAFHIPQQPQPWLRNRIEGPRVAAVQCSSWGGGAAHCVLEEAPVSSVTAVEPPPFPDTHALFVLEGDGPTDLLVQTEELERQLREGLHPLHHEATLWLQQHPLQPERSYGIALIAQSHAQALEQLQQLNAPLSQGDIPHIRGKHGIYSTPSPLCAQGRLAFVYPGSGNHYVEMGRQLGLRFPQALARMDAETERLQDQMLPHLYMPWRHNWPTGWRTQAAQRIAAHAHHMIFGQVVHGGFVTEVCRLFALQENAVIGYSLGESAGLFASKAWPERGHMLQRMEASQLFQTQLAGPCDIARQVWEVPADEDVAWRTAVVQCSAAQVKEYLAASENSLRTARLLIVNTPDECVVGGRQKDVEALIQKLQCEAIYLEGIVTVHCEVVEPVKEAYRSLHLFPTTAAEHITYYSGYLGGSYPLTRDNAADSILNQALYGFDYTRTIQQAYNDGIRLFVEMGPRNSCTRMIHKILKGQPHFAQSACISGEQDVFTLQKLLGGLLAERVPVQLDALYPGGCEKNPPAMYSTVARGPSLPAEEGQDIGLQHMVEDSHGEVMTGHTEHIEHPSLLAGRGIATRSPYYEGVGSGRQSRHTVPSSRVLTGFSNSHPDRPLHVTVPVGHMYQLPSLPKKPKVEAPHTMSNREKPAEEKQMPRALSASLVPQSGPFMAADHTMRAGQVTSPHPTSGYRPSATFPHLAADILPGMTATWEACGQAHDTYLRLSQQNQQAMLQTLTLQQQLLESALTNTAEPAETSDDSVAFTKAQCMEFAVGSIANVLGPEFAEIDSYAVRVRLPDEPLMLVDRILTISGEKKSLGSGSLVTEHDVLPGAWYLDAERMPVCVTVEAGQADLFLCSYLGIDFKLKGRRAYRLLDAEIHFHRELPRHGETIRYDITIDKFVRQGEVYLFFFRFDGTIDGQPLLTMRNGCAGFFTEEEIHGSRGIVRSSEEWKPRPGQVAEGWQPLVPFEQPESYDEQQVEALRRGDYAACFGPMFGDLRLQEPTYLPSGKMKLFDRVLEVNPTGGRYGLGLVRAEADIHPDDWFLTCHFMDDMVMPGTLMYECCAHTLRVLLMRMGWVGEHSTTHFEPVPGIKTKLACRGPVTPASQKVVYEVEIKELGIHPYPYVLADALMYVDGKCSVSFDNMSMQMTGQSFADLQQLWANRPVIKTKTSPLSGKPIRYDTEQILAYAIGKPSEGFGAPYQIFDQERVIARLPGPPYLFLDRVVEVEPEPWVLKAGGWIETEYEIPADAWYFRANQQPVMPFAVLLEVALQPCGWLAAYLGSALHSNKDMSFRNLGGEGKLTALTLPTSEALTVRVQMYEVSKAGGMLIERFYLKVFQQGELIYDGITYFGFFTKAALAHQVGIIDAKDRAYEPTQEALQQATSHTLEDTAPFFPEDGPLPAWSGATMPDKALRMVDSIDIFLPQGGPHQLGFLRGSKQVDPEEWFFTAHFYQDPVCPGSLGLESFLQLLRFYMLQRWGDSHGKDHIFEPILLHETHRWEYRGQILPTAKEVVVDAVITEVIDGPQPQVRASGFLKVDGLFIYEMIDFGLRMIPHPEES